MTGSKSGIIVSSCSGDEDTRISNNHYTLFSIKKKPVTAIFAVSVAAKREAKTNIHHII